MKSTVKLPKTCRAPHGARGLKSDKSRGGWGSTGSRPARGAWIEIYGYGAPDEWGWCRAPHGARGLKFIIGKLITAVTKSRPARGAWIEISNVAMAAVMEMGRAPHGARGLKFLGRQSYCV